MHPDLEAIVAADEECRSRVTLADSRRERDVSAARAKRDASIETRRAAALEALKRELAAIRSEGDQRLVEIREQQKVYLESLAKNGEAKFAAAVDKYLSIVCRTEER
ncbi:MAG TPA: hypothetical protein VKU62_02635 [Thermoanaerobaculia bacterium]|nr:hypothetical protein [Thermoanaerobaculia bacterium]